MAKQIICYAVSVSTDEMFNVCILRQKFAPYEFHDITGGKKNGFIGVYQDEENAAQVFLYDTPKNRNDAFKRFNEHFRTAAVVLNPAYVDEKYIKGR